MADLQRLRDFLAGPTPPTRGTVIEVGTGTVRVATNGGAVVVAGDGGIRVGDRVTMSGGAARATHVFRV